MTKDFIAHCKVVDGHLQWRNVDYLAVNLPKWEGYDGVLKIKKKWNKRSTSQNSLYWVWVTLIAESCGNTPEEMHTIFKGLYAPKIEVKYGKKSFMIPRSTTSLTKGEMVEFMFNVQTEAANLGIVLPTPEDYEKERTA